MKITIKPVRDVITSYFISSDAVVKNIHFSGDESVPDIRIISRGITGWAERRDYGLKILEEYLINNISDSYELNKILSNLRTYEGEFTFERVNSLNFTIENIDRAFSAGWGIRIKAYRENERDIFGVKFVSEVGIFLPTDMNEKVKMVFDRLMEECDRSDLRPFRNSKSVFCKKKLNGYKIDIGAYYEDLDKGLRLNFESSGTDESVMFVAPSSFIKDIQWITEKIYL